MSDSIIKIYNGDQRIEIPLAAMVHFDQLVDLAHLVVLSVPVQASQSGGADAAKAAVAKAAASPDPLAALRKLAEGLGSKTEDGLTAERVEKGRKLDEDPAVRLLEHTRKCAKSLDISPPDDAPVQAIVTAIAAVAADRGEALKAAQELMVAQVRNAKLEPAEETGFPGLVKNVKLLGHVLYGNLESSSAIGRQTLNLHSALKVFGVTIQNRPGSSTEQMIKDAADAIRVAGRRSHVLKEAVPK